MSDHYTYSINDLFEQWRMTDSISARESIEQELNERIVPTFYRCNLKGMPNDLLEGVVCKGLMNFASESLNDENYFGIKVDPKHSVYNPETGLMTKIAFKRPQVDTDEQYIEYRCSVPYSFIEKILEPGYVEKFMISFHDQVIKNYKRHYDNIKYRYDHIDDEKKDILTDLDELKVKIENSTRKRDILVNYLKTVTSNEA